MDFYLKLKGEQVGPYRLEEVQGWLNAEFVKPDDTAWFDGCEDWVKVEELPGIDLNAAGHFVRTDEALPFEAYVGEEPYVFRLLRSSGFDDRLQANQRSPRGRISDVV